MKSTHKNTITRSTAHPIGNLNIYKPLKPEECQAVYEELFSGETVRMTEDDFEVFLSELSETQKEYVLFNLDRIDNGPRYPTIAGFPGYDEVIRFDGIQVLGIV